MSTLPSTDPIDRLDKIIEAIGVEPYYREKAGVIFCADCLDILPKIPDKSIDLVLTDPPYGLSYCSNWGTPRDPIINDSFSDWLKLMTAVIPFMQKILKDNTAIFMFMANSNIETIKPLLDNQFKWKNFIVWDKGNWSAGGLEGNYGMQYELIYYGHKGKCTINGKRHPNIWRFPRVNPETYKHPTTKPVDLMKRMIEGLSNENEIIIDGFMGVGGTAVAAKQLGRQFIGIEISETYAKIAVQRLAQEILI